MQDWERVADWARFYRDCCLKVRERDYQSEDGVRVAGTFVVGLMRKNLHGLNRSRQFYQQQFGHGIDVSIEQIGKYTGKKAALHTKTLGDFVCILIEHREYSKAIQTAREQNLRGVKLLRVLNRATDLGFMRTTAVSALSSKESGISRLFLFRLAGWCAAVRNERREEILRELPAQVLSLIAKPATDESEEIEKLPYRAVEGTRTFEYGRREESVTDLTAIEEFRPAEFDPAEAVLARLIAREELEKQFTPEELDTLLLDQDGLTYEEIARIRGEKEAAVSQRLYRARKRVRPKSEPS